MCKWCINYILDLVCKISIKFGFLVHVAVAVLETWEDSTKKSMLFDVPMIWREPSNLVTDCYFCLIDTLGFSIKTKHIKYPNVSSVTRLEGHIPHLPVPEPSECVSSTFALETNEQNDEFLPSAAEASNLLTSESHIINQEELNDLYRDLNLWKQQSELPGSRLQQWNLLQKSTKITYARKCAKNLESFFSLTGNFVYCSDINSLMEELAQKHELHE